MAEGNRGRSESVWRSTVSGSGINGEVISCKFAAWSVIDSDVAGLPMVLSRDAGASSGREPATGEPGDETGELRGR